MRNGFRQGISAEHVGSLVNSYTRKQIKFSQGLEFKGNMNEEGCAVTINIQKLF